VCIDTVEHSFLWSKGHGMFGDDGQNQEMERRHAEEM
jgi:hypothetical protein